MSTRRRLREDLREHGALPRESVSPSRTRPHEGVLPAGHLPVCPCDAASSPVADAQGGSPALSPLSPGACGSSGVSAPGSGSPRTLFPPQSEGQEVRRATRARSDLCVDVACRVFARVPPPKAQSRQAGSRPLPLPMGGEGARLFVKQQYNFDSPSSLSCVLGGKCQRPSAVSAAT